MKIIVLITLVIAQVRCLHLLPDDWLNNTIWQDDSYCDSQSDNFLVFDVTEDKDSVIASRDGCYQWCLNQLDKYAADCCGQAFYGTSNETYFISYCALYKLGQEGQITMEVDDDGTTITAFSSALMVFENELED